MGVAFEADSVAVESNPESLRVVFAAESAGESHRLEFTRLPGDSNPGSAVECRCDQLGIIDGIVRVLLTPTRVVVAFAQEARVKKPREFVVGFRATAEERRAIRLALKQTFRDTRLFVDDAVTGLGLLRAIIVGPPTPTSELLVVPTYLTVVGAIVGGILAGAQGPWWIPVGVLAGSAGGFLWGLLQRRRFYDLHKYR